MSGIETARPAAAPARTGEPGDWLRQYAPADADAPDLVVLPHAGGSAAFFGPLARALAPAVRVLVVQYPGRLERHRHRAVEDIRELARHTAGAVAAHTGGAPVAYFGHSMGALVAYEAALLGEQGLGPVPRALFVSAGRAPVLTRVDPAVLHDDESLIEQVLWLGATSKAVLDVPDLRELILPALWADYRALAAYVPDHDARISCPVTALIGDSDPLVPVEDAARWRDHTTGAFRLQVLPGDHFYLAPRLAHVTDTVRTVLTELF
ncbi:thioesterase II family protein [Streptomyces sp. NPDC102451]|uniref:thioesterase II family protein n=1 Tax=Streptomyces sp. NPDC102451 TaxID=3366177 RepID=UPI003801CE9B